MDETDRWMAGRRRAYGRAGLAERKSFDAACREHLCPQHAATPCYSQLGPNYLVMEFVERVRHGFPEDIVMQLSLSRRRFLKHLGPF